MTDPSNWHDANPGVIMCPRCGETLQAGHVSLVHKEQDGSYSCNSCATSFRVPKGEQQ